MTRRAQATIVCGLLALGASGVAALAAPPSCGTLEEFLDCVTVDAVRDHQAVLQAIADAHGGTRVSGTAGYDASVDYVVDQMTAAGYDVTVQPFQFQTFIELSPSLLDQIAPAPTGPIPHNLLSYSGSGDHTAAVSTLAVTTGCNAADFAGFPAGNIALIERGTCTFAVKATNAFAAGAAGVVIYNNVPGALSGTLSSTFALDISVVAVSQSVGQQLAITAGLVLRLKTETFRGMATSYNVLAETPGGAPNDVVMVGAHLDSVNAGPGIQDNGSGGAAILETALQLAPLHVQRKVRFAWWGAQESGRLGSTHYVDNLAPGDLARISRYLDFHMLGSPNYVFLILDGDDSDGMGVGPGPPGSGAIEALLESFYASRGHPYKGADLDGRSDYLPFSDAGIPVGGLFTGAEGIKTPEEVAIWGGTAGDPYDPCYHLACDTFANVNLAALDINADAVAYAVFQYAGVQPVIQEIPTLSAAGVALLALLLAGAGALLLRRT